MDPLFKIKEEHQEIEQYLQEIEMIISSDEINHPNLMHTCRELANFLNAHEEKERIIFDILAKESFKIPVRIIDFQHGELKNHLSSLLTAIESGRENKLKISLATHGIELIKKIREHLRVEDEIIYTLPVDQFSEETISLLNSLNSL